MTWQSVLPLLILLSTSCTGLLTFFVPERKPLLRALLNVGGVFLCVILIVILMVGVFRGDVFNVRIALLPNIDLVFHADALSLLFIGLSGVLWGLTSIYATGYLQGSKDQSRFFGFFGLCVFATMGIALAGNLITFLIFYELLTLTTYPLVAHRGNAASIRAAKVYLIYTMVGGGLFLAGVVWLKALAGPLDFVTTGVLANLEFLSPGVLQVIFVLIIAGLGVKAALVPLHGWLPIAMAAPAPVSALLHAVAVVKAGAFGIVRVVYDVYGVEFASSLGLTLGLAIVASFTIVYGSIRALFQDDLKRRMAYSTVSQVSYIALGTAIAGPIATIGGIVHLVHQGLMKITLFFCAGSFAETLGVSKVSQMSGVGKRMPLTMGAFTIASLGMIGVPPLAGFVSKWYLGLGALEANMPWVLAILVASSLLNAAYLLPILYFAWFKQPSQPWPREHTFPRFETHWMLLVPPIATAIFVVIAGVFANSVFSPLNWAELIAQREYDQPFTNAVKLAVQNSWGLWVAIIVPLTVAILSVTPLKNLSYRLTPITAMPALAIAVLASDNSLAQVQGVFLGSSLNLDDTSRVFLGLSGALWLLISIWGQSYFAHDPRKHSFTVFYLVAMAGNFGLVLSSDLFGFLTFFTLMSFASYGLIVHSQTHQARLAGKAYIQWVVLGELMLFVGLAGFMFATTQTPSSQPQWVTAFLVAGFGVKTGLFLLHTWLPRAHPVAPVPASALLSGIMVKAGLLGMLRFLPFGDFGSETIGLVLSLFGLIGAFGGVIAGLTQSNSKAILAYSTVSQMGVITTGLGVGLMQPAVWPTLMPLVILYGVHHGFTKAALFLSVGVYPTLIHTRPLRLLAWASVWLPALIMAGAPLTGAMAVKAAFKSAAAPVGWLPLCLTLSGIGTAMLMCRFISAKHCEQPKPNAATMNTVSGMALGVLITLSAMGVFIADRSLGTQLKPLGDYDIVASSLAPLLGLITFLLVRKHLQKIAAIPLGDIAIFYEKFANFGLSKLSVNFRKLKKVMALSRVPLAANRLYFSSGFRHLRAIDLGVFFTPGVAFLGILTVTLLTLLLARLSS